MGLNEMVVLGTDILEMVVGHVGNWQFQKGAQHQLSTPEGNEQRS